MIVVGVIVAETVHSVLSIHWGYYYLIKSNGHPDAYQTATFSLSLFPLTVISIFVLSELFYIRRVYHILRTGYRHIFLVIAVSLVLCSIAFGIAVTVEVFIHGTFANWLHFKWLVSAAYGPPAVGDFIVAIVLVVTLHRSHTGIKRTDALLNVLKIYGFSTGLFCSLLSLTCLLIDVMEETNMMIVPFSMTAANLYAFSMLVTLNMRRGLVEKLESEEVATEWLGLSALHRADDATERSTADNSSIRFNTPRRSCSTETGGAVYTCTTV
ncbi:hypothetical protein C8Q74DRAFT_883598 [Fomes fomentarius]|nr:hypothetical protein C8Q74DRAFT_883598 [Fomes fomentarius]